MEPYSWGDEPYPQTPKDSARWLDATRIKRDNLELQQIIDNQRAEIEALKDIIHEIEERYAAVSDGLQLARLRIDNAVRYLECSERYYPQKIDAALRELGGTDASR